LANDHVRFRTRYPIETHQNTQSDVAAGTGLADSTLSDIIADKRKLTVKQINALARFFGKITGCARLNNV
jgi:antitoxin component HigA of HigAB toxin-antitoxin module